MAPIHDSDLAEERWTKSSWEHYELWEKIEHRLRRRKALWILATTLVFLGLSSIPVINERRPKWESLALSRKLSSEINSIKLRAIREHQALRLRFVGQGSLDYRIESASHCSSREWKHVGDGKLSSAGAPPEYRLMTPAEGEALGVPGLTESFCYDYLAGSDAVLADRALVGFAIAPVNSLSDEERPKYSLLLLKGPSAEISFE